MKVINRMTIDVCGDWILNNFEHYHTKEALVQDFKEYMKKYFEEWEDKQ